MLVALPLIIRTRLRRNDFKALSFFLFNGAVWWSCFFFCATKVVCWRLLDDDDDDDDDDKNDDEFGVMMILCD